MHNDKSESQGHSFGTFTGVFTPSILTIFGLIMFMRTSYVVGHAGVYGALVILLIAKIITFATGLSISAISTNTPVKGGGAYFLISRALGPGFGSSIGVALFTAQALSVPFYIFGFSEAVVKNFALPPELYLWIAVGTGVIIFIITWVGADWVIKFQFVILIVLVLAITVFLTGAMTQFTWEQFAANTLPMKADSNAQSLTTLFAIFFPAVTGIMAGVNMSGDLKDPGQSIPRGSLWAIAISFVVYGLQMFVTGGAFTRTELISTPYLVLVQNALFGAGFLVSLGVYAATLSSALGSFLGSPRVLQALALDRILSWLNPFSKGSGSHNEPKRALLLTAVISFAILIVGGLQGVGEGGFLNMIAEVVTMFFLYTYGIVNLAAFVESFGANPSFRPRFTYYHWGTALFGALSCIIVSFMINPVAATLALFIIGALYLLASRADMAGAFGDARRGFVFSRIRSSLLALRDMPHDHKNWRPTILVLMRDLTLNYPILKFGSMFECNSGILSVATFIDGDVEDVRKERKAQLGTMRRFAEANELEIFPEVIATTSLDIGLDVFLQAHSIGPVKPNIVMTPFPVDPSRAERFAKHLRVLSKLSLSSVVMVDPDGTVAPKVEDPRIDIWWRGHSNGSLMFILSYLLCRNPQWEKASIRVLRIIPDASFHTDSRSEMQELVDAARIDATIKIIVSGESFVDIYRRESKDASALFLGYMPPTPEQAEESYNRICEWQKDMPPTFYVSSTGDADLLA